MSTKKTMERLKKSKLNRAAYVTSQINIGLPFQIRALRKQKKWDQKTLAKESGMSQPRISLMEKVGYGSFNIDTLKQLANAFDVALVVRFAPFSETLRFEDNFSPDNFSIPSFVEEMDHAAGARARIVDAEIRDVIATPVFRNFMLISDTASVQKKSGNRSPR